MSKVVEINFQKAAKHVYVRPGQIVDIAVDGVRVRVEGIDYAPFKCETPSVPPNMRPDMYVHLRPGEAYRAKREDGTVLHVLAEERNA